MVEQPTQEQILGTILPYLREIQKHEGSPLEITRTLPTFSLDDLVGKTITAVPKIKNPEPENGCYLSDPLNVQLFADGSYLLNVTSSIGGDGTHHSFLVSGNIVKHRNGLYE